MGICLMPGRDLPSVSLWEFDKIVHFGVYFLLAVLLHCGWKKQTTFPYLHRQTMVKITIACVVFGFGVEILQEWLTADRHFDIFDAAANGLGGVVGAWAVAQLKF